VIKGKNRKVPWADIFRPCRLHSPSQVFSPVFFFLLKIRVNSAVLVGERWEAECHLVLEMTLSRKYALDFFFFFFCVVVDISWAPTRPQMTTTDDGDASPSRSSQLLFFFFVFIISLPTHCHGESVYTFLVGDVSSWVEGDELGRTRTSGTPIMPQGLARY
jgi:hypothetical protein